MKRKILGILLICLLAVTLASCKKDEAEKTEKPNDTVKTETLGNSEETETPVTDDEQRKLQEERDQLEAERKEKYGEFYVPLPALGQEQTPKKVAAKGIFVTTSAAGQSFSEENIDAYAAYVENGGSEPDVNTIEELLGIVKGTELNTIVVDVKTDEGYVTYDSDIEIVKTVDSTVPATDEKFKTLADYCEANDIYLIARIVTFKDHYFAESQPDHAIQLEAGGVYRDDAGDSWVNPFDTYVWNYVTAIAKEAALVGFDEIQFDYVRFPDGAARYNPITHFPGREGRDKDEAIADFLSFAREELKPYGVGISADVFGIITHTWDDEPEDIGQTWIMITDKVDAISPMIYPSHYSTGWYGYDYPDQHPYGVLYQSMQEAIERNAAVKNPAAIRPWIQAFTAPWVDGYMDYGPQAISDQIVACRELGIEEYLLWAVNNSFDPNIFSYEDRIAKEPRTAEQDLLDQTPAQAVERYLRAQYNELRIPIFLLTPLQYRDADYDTFAKIFDETDLALESYTVGEAVKTDRGYDVAVDAVYTSQKGVATLTGQAFQVIEEGGVYKVIVPELTFEEPKTEAPATEEVADTEEPDTEEEE